jgi:uncharacterized protein (TIGR00251 family)
MYLKIKVIAGAKAEKIEKHKEDEWRVWVKEPAENNHANNRILAIVRDVYPNVSVRIVSGHHSPSKIVSIE